MSDGEYGIGHPERTPDAEVVAGPNTERSGAEKRSLPILAQLAQGVAVVIGGMLFILAAAFLVIAGGKALGDVLYYLFPSP